jgi:4-hydroxy 2-oxovalerate aldolase
VDGCTRALGAGAGNTPTEVLVAVLDRLGMRTGIDTLAAIDAAEDVVRPLMEAECARDRMSVLMGYAGVYSSFLRHAERIAKRYDVPGAEILIRAGQRNLVGGQEDQLVGIAVELAREAARGARGVTAGER